MAAPTELDKLRARVAELEQQITEERDEHQWDLKASQESTAKTIHKLEEELAQLRKAPAGAAMSAPPKGAEADMLTQRALLAERRVAELQQELRRVGPLAAPAAAKEDPVLRQRVEAAEAERDELRRVSRDLGKNLEEKKVALEKTRKELEDGKRARQEAENLRRDLASRDRELKLLREQGAARPDPGKELAQKAAELAQRVTEIAGLRAELSAKAEEIARQKSVLDGKEQKLQNLTTDLNKARAATAREPAPDAAHKQRVTELEAEVARLNQELAKVELASGQMVEHRVREVERLKVDLQEVRDREGSAKGQLESLKREITRLKEELKNGGITRDKMSSELRNLRESQNTQVGRRQEPEADPFDEKTVPAASPRGATALPADDRTASPTSAWADLVQEQVTAPAMPVPPRKLSESSDSNLPVITGTMDEIARDAEPASSGELFEVIPDQPGGPVAEARDAGGLEAVPETTSGELESLPELEPEPLEEGGPGGASAPLPVDDSRPLELADRTAEVHARKETRTDELPMAEARRQVKPRSSHKAILLFLLFGLIAAGIVAVVLLNAQKWWGLGEAEEPRRPGVADRDAGVARPPAPETAAADAGEAPAADAAANEGAGVADGGPAQDGGPAVSAEPAPAAAPTPEQLAELQKIQAQVRKLQAQKKFKPAADLAQEALAKGPDDAGLHFLLARSLFALRQTQAAAEEAERAVKLDPELADAYLDLGGIYLKLGQKGQACEALGTFLKLRPKDKYAAGIKKTLKKNKCPESP